MRKLLQRGRICGNLNATRASQSRRALAVFRDLCIGLYRGHRFSCKFRHGRDEFWPCRKTNFVFWHEFAGAVSSEQNWKSRALGRGRRMITYVDLVLEPSETVRYRTTVSWIVYVPSLLLT